jgi:hypothetical protein
MDWTNRELSQQEHREEIWDTWEKEKMSPAGQKGWWHPGEMWPSYSARVGFKKGILKNQRRIALVGFALVIICSLIGQSVTCWRNVLFIVGVSSSTYETIDYSFSYLMIYVV